MSRSVLLATALIATAAFGPQAPATAQDSASITVSVPSVHPAPRNAGQPRNSVHPRLQAAANVVIGTADLDLRTAYGRNLLDRRIRVAADAACDQIDAIDPPVGLGGWIHDAGDCRHLAVRRAEPQRWAVIRAAG